MTAIETSGLTKRYGGGILDRDGPTVAVDDLDLTVADGEVYGFLGPNGAGKSTTIDLLLDYVRPTAGSASVLGHDVREERERIRRRVGVLPDGVSLYDRLTGRRHLEFAVEWTGSDDDPDALAARVGLAADATGRRVGGYSKGMRQRLALAMALVGGPDLLILDEPTSGLDPNGIRLVREVVREASERGTTVFFSSHDLTQVEAVCDRVGIVDDGSLVAVDAVDDIGDGDSLEDVFAAHTTGGDVESTDGRDVAREVRG